MWHFAWCHAGMDPERPIPGDTRVPLPSLSGWILGVSPHVSPPCREVALVRLGSDRPLWDPQSPKCFSLPLQTAGYTSPTPFGPMSPTVGSPPRPLAMHFGPMSPSLDPALFFGPSASGQLNLR